MVDITERKKAEDALKETLAKMEALNEKLGVIGKLTRHNSRNNLSTIANNAYLAKQQLGKDHAALTNLTDIELSVDHIEKLLEFSRIYELLGTEELSYVDVKKSFEEAVLLLSCPVDVDFVSECDGLAVRADSLLRQIFYNLIDNSLKHGEKVSQIKVYCKEGKAGLELVYEDDGVGIPAAEKEKIFGEGYGKGTGFGLYLIQKICEAYGWSIHETSERGKGAQFVIIIPKLNKNGKPNYTA
jgi:signal transduction histidine kinase